jgi:pyroglutamyl-peptidase
VRLTCFAVVAACASPVSPTDPNAGLLRDFLDGKFDSAGHPLNAIVIDAAALCPAAPAIAGGCAGALPPGARDGELEVNVHMRVRAHGNADIVYISVRDGNAILASDTLTAARLRADDTWIDVALPWQGDGNATRIELALAADAEVDLGYVEVFPQRFGLVVGPGSSVLGDSDRLTVELPLGRAIERATLDGADASFALATRTDTALRTLYDIAVGQLAPARGDVAELAVRGADTAARMQLRRTAPSCAFEGDPNGVKVLVTGFQPFPADATHENVSGVAIGALDPSKLRGAQVMRLVLPVEYDRAAAEVADAIARCQIAIAISFGQGGGEIALEETAYNLQDTGELAGGAPDNRGIVRSATPIDSAAPATRATLLPLTAIESALKAIGEAPEHSTDPGRYVCNNVMFADLGAIGAGRAGFIHLPYTTEFDDAGRARFGAIVAAAIQATVDAP